MKSILAVHRDQGRMQPRGPAREECAGPDVGVAALGTTLEVLSLAGGLKPEVVWSLASGNSFGLGSGS